MRYDNEFVSAPACPIPTMGEDGVMRMVAHPQYKPSELPLEGELCRPTRRKISEEARALGVTRKRLRKLKKRRLSA